MTVQQTRQNALHIMDETGDSRTVWDPSDPISVEIAEAAYNAAKEKGYYSYTVDPETKGQGEVIHEFDPQAGAIIMAPQLVGG